MADITLLLDAIQRGEPDAAGALLTQVYAELRQLARAKMAREQPGHTLQPTALVHEAWLRLGCGVEEGKAGEQRFENRAHFFGAAAEAMRRILVEHARARGRIKRGGDSAGRPAGRVPLNVLDLAQESEPDEILALEEQIRRLETDEPEVGAVVRLRFFAGLSGDETAAALGISPRQVDRLWAYARAWLHRAMEPGPQGASGDP